MRGAIATALTLFVALGAGATPPTAPLDSLLSFLIGMHSDSADQDHNSDGTVDVADLVSLINETSPGISPAERMELIDAAAAQWQTILDADGDLSARNEAMVTWLEGQALIRAAGVSSQEAVWAAFTDDLPLVVIDNRPPGDPTDIGFGANPASAAAEPGTRRRSAPAATGPQPQGVPTVWLQADMPFGRRAEVLSSFGEGFHGDELTTELRVAFSTHGYELGPATERDDARTIPDYRSLDSVDVLYMTGHGDSGSFTADPLLQSLYEGLSWISTNDVVDASDYTAHREDIAEARLLPVVGPYSLDAQGGKVVESRWGITDRFIREHMSFGAADERFFGRHGLVLMDGCTTAGANSGLDEACFEKGAAIYFGWTAPVDDASAIEPVAHLIARLFGERTPFAEAARPFDIDTIWQEMTRSGWTTAAAADPGNPQVSLTLTRGGQSQLAILRPMLHTLRIFAASEQLHLYGMFTDDTSDIATPPADKVPRVTVGGTELTLQEWTRRELICDLPSSGAGSFGEVIVEIDGVQSNPVSLTQYQGTANFTLSTQQEGVYATGSTDFRFRTATTPYRIRPGDDPVFPWVSLLALGQDDPDLSKFFVQHEDFTRSKENTFEADSTFDYEYDGEYPTTCSAGAALLTGSGSLDCMPFDPGSVTFLEDAFASRPFFLSPTLDPEDNVWSFSLKTDGAVGTITYPGECQILPQEIDRIREPLGFEEPSVAVDAADFVIPAGSHISSDGQMTIEWEEMTPEW